MNHKEKLYREIKKFTKWADQCQPTWSEERDNGEWELGYPHFEELCGAAEDVVNEYPCSEAADGISEVHTDIDTLKRQQCTKSTIKIRSRVAQESGKEQLATQNHRYKSNEEVR